MAACSDDVDLRVGAVSDVIKVCDDVTSSGELEGLKQNELRRVERRTAAAAAEEEEEEESCLHVSEGLTTLTLHSTHTRSPQCSL